MDINSPPPIPCFVELPPFQRHRQDYLDDEAYRQLQLSLMQNPELGVLIRGTGGLRKVRFEDTRRGKGKRGGLRIIYYYWFEGAEFWLFTVYNKDEMADLSEKERQAFKALLTQEINERRANAAQHQRNDAIKP